MDTKKLNEDILGASSRDEHHLIPESVVPIQGAESLGSVVNIDLWLTQSAPVSFLSPFLKQGVQVFPGH